MDDDELDDAVEDAPSPIIDRRLKIDYVVLKCARAAGLPHRYTRIKMFCNCIWSDMIRTIAGDSDKFREQHVEDLRTYGAKSWVWGSIWKETQRKARDQEEGFLTPSQMWVVWGEHASLYSTAMAGMTKKDKTDCVQESHHKVRWWDMDLNQLYRDWTGASEAASRAINAVGNPVLYFCVAYMRNLILCVCKIQIPGVALTGSAAAAAKDAVTVGMSWKKVQEAHLLCMHRGEDRKTDFHVNKLQMRWRRNHRRKLERWQSICARVSMVGSQHGVHHQEDPTVSDDEVDQHVEENPSGQDPQTPLNPLVPPPDVDHTPKMKVQHMPARRVRLGAGWKMSNDQHMYKLTYYDHELRLCVTTDDVKLKQAKKRGGSTQCFWHLDLVWRIWTSTPRAIDNKNIVVHLVFAGPPQMRESLYVGKKRYAVVRSVRPSATSTITTHRSYIQMEVERETWSKCERVIRLRRGVQDVNRHTILFESPPPALCGWTKYSHSLLRGILESFETKLAAGEESLLGAWIRSWAKGHKSEDDPWYDDFCTRCEELIEEYLREMSNRSGYWAVTECVSCGRKTAWHKKSGLRFLVDDFDCNGNPKPGSVPHFFCSELIHLRKKFENNEVYTSAHTHHTHIRIIHAHTHVHTHTYTHTHTHVYIHTYTNTHTHTYTHTHTLTRTLTHLAVHLTPAQRTC